MFFIDSSLSLGRLFDESADRQIQFNFTLPATTPPGAYLLRFEYFMPTSLVNKTQWFINCALVNIHGPNPAVKPGTPQGFVKFPGAYDPEDPGEISFIQVMIQFEKNHC